MAERTKAIDSKSIRGPKGSSGVRIPLPPPPISSPYDLQKAMMGGHPSGENCTERCESWVNRHAWRACVPHKGTVGSNPTLSVSGLGETTYTSESRQHQVQGALSSSKRAFVQEQGAWYHGILKMRSC